MIDSDKIAFRGERWYLSNYYPYAPFHYKGIDFASSEHFFHTCKTFDPQHQQLIIHSATPGDAKKNGKAITLRDDWEDVKINIMRIALYLKFLQNQHLLKKLISTGDEILVETNTWHDNVWGQCGCTRCRKSTGQNWLGVLLMELRETYR